MNLEKVELLARHQHRNQTRWDKETPYITHVEAVAEMMITDDEKMVAWLHDVVEDTDVTLEELRDLRCPEHIVEAVDAITKREGEVYDDYIDRVISNGLASVVKMADITHNLSNLKRGSMRDKYLIARKYIGLHLALNSTLSGLYREQG